MLRRGTKAILLFVLFLVAIVAYQRLQTGIATEVYRDRLRVLSHRYEDLRQTYNQAVKRTAVTELVVDGGRLSVVIRTVEGVRQVIQTPFDPYGEVFVDYVVIDGRLWIRRLFDAHTRPSEALVFDPLLGEVDWDAPEVAYGKAVYRRLGEGRWVVTVTGDGSLGLAIRSDPTGPIELTPCPSVQDYPQIQRQIDREIERIGVADVWGKLIGLGATMGPDPNR